MIYHAHPLLPPEPAPLAPIGLVDPSYVVDVEAARDCSPAVAEPVLFESDSDTLRVASCTSCSSVAAVVSTDNGDRQCDETAWILREPAEISLQSAEPA